MMNSPFYRNHSSSSPAKKKKVVRVPVQFISSDTPPTIMSTRESAAAVKIQKVVRGFVVRKSVKKISSVRKEIVNIEQRITKEEEFISWDPKERLRVNESIMSLVLKLDSIRGFDSGVRDFRKSVTKMAIALQDKVDSIAQPQPPHHDSSNSNKQNNVKEEEEEEEEIDVDDAKEIVGCSMEVQKHKDPEEEEEKERWEKVMRENDKMKQMMEQRNEMHTRMINSLTRRLDHLENAFLLTTMIKNQQKKKMKTNKSKSNALRRRRRRERMEDYTW